MKLYVFRTSNYGNPKLHMDEYEVEEKNKSYICKHRRFNKSNIGIVTGYNADECILLEDNPRKAAEVLIKAKEKDLERINDQLQRKIAEIKNLEMYIREE